MKAKSIIYIFTSLTLIVFIVLSFNFIRYMKNMSMMPRNAITEIQIGETYTYGYGFDYDNSNGCKTYVKFLDDNYFLEVADGAHLIRPEGFKFINVYLGKYKKKKGGYIETMSVSSFQIGFTPDEDVKKGSSGFLSEFDVFGDIPNFDNSGTAIKKYGGRYYYTVAYSYNEDTGKEEEVKMPESVVAPGTEWLRKSSLKLPNSVEEYLEQYNLKLKN